MSGYVGEAAHIWNVNGEAIRANFINKDADTEDVLFDEFKDLCTQVRETLKHGKSDGNMRSIKRLMLIAFTWDVKYVTEFGGHNLIVHDKMVSVINNLADTFVDVHRANADEWWEQAKTIPGWADKNFASMPGVV
jgi:hypothetical protein